MTTTETTTMTTKYQIAPRVVAELCDDCHLRTLDPTRYPLSEILARPYRDMSDIDDEGYGRHVLSHEEYIEAGGRCDAEVVTDEVVTDEQIDALLVEAAAHGNLVQVAICQRARGYSAVDYAQTPALTLTPAERVRVDAMSQDAARAECARVIAAARAME